MGIQLLTIATSSIAEFDSQMRLEEDDHIAENITRYFKQLCEFRKQTGEEEVVPWPAIDVFHDPKKDVFLIGDGWQRYGAHCRAGDKEIKVILHDSSEMGETCPYRAAILFATGANAQPGVVRSNAAKRRSVETILRDETWVQWSDRRIAKSCRVSHPFVGEIRAEMEEAGEIQPQVDRTAERGGQEYQHATPAEAHVETLPHAQEDVTSGEDTEAPAEPWDLTDEEEASISGDADDDSSDEEQEPLSSTTQVYAQRMEEYNAPFMRMRSAVREGRKKVKATYDNMTAGQFPSSRFHTLDNALKAVDDAIAPCIAKGLCQECGGAGCDQCKQLGWLNAQQLEQQSRES